MKKCTKLFIPLCALACLTLASCELLTPAHTHDFQTEWSNNEIYHWHPCKEEKCTEFADKAEHDFENDACSVCGYTLSTTKTTVTEEEFNAALSFENVTSYTILQDGEEGLLCQDNKRTFFEDDSAFYFVDHEAYVDFYYEENGTWYKTKVFPEDEQYESFYIMLNFTDLIFRDMSFDDFTYENGVYTGNNCTLGFENGQLVSFTNYYEEDGDITESVMTFENYNATTVTLPTEYTDLNAVTEEEFYAALSFENVTSYTLSEDGESVLYLEGDKAKASYIDDEFIYIEDHETYVDFYYEENATWYKTQVSPEDENYEEYYSMLHFAEFFFGYISFGDFTYENGVYTGSSNTLGNCSLRIEGGQLVALTIYYEEDDNVSSTDFTFTNYNSTTVTLPTEYTDLSGGNS